MSRPGSLTDRAGPAGAGTAPGRRHVPGEQGVWVLILGDMTVFAVLFATYLFYRGHSPEAFTAAQRFLNADFGAINTGLLLVSSLLVVLAVRAMRVGAPGPAPRLIAGAAACGLGFSALKIVEYSHEIAGGHTPAASEFFMYYFVLTGLHWFHLLVGLAVLAAMLRLARRGALTPRHFAFVEGGACFWHMVDLLWIVLFPLLYMVR